MDDEKDETPDVSSMIADSIGDAAGSSSASAMDDLEIRITGADDDGDDKGSDGVIEIYSAPVQGDAPRKRGRPAGSANPRTRKKAEIVEENEQLQKRIADLTSKGDPQMRQNIATMAQMLAITLYGGLAEWRGMLHYALTEDEAKAFGDAVQQSMPAAHIEAIGAKAPYAMPAIALFAPLVRGVMAELKLRRLNPEPPKT